MASNVPAVTSAVRIMERLAAEWPDAVSPRDLVQELGLNRSTCYNILSTLQEAGWLRSLGDRAGWTLGPRLLTLTGVTDEMALTIMQEEIEALTRRLGFVTFIAEPDGSGGYVAVARAERRRGVRVTVGVGEYFEFSAPAIMYAFHSWEPDEVFDALVDRIRLKPFTSKTLVDRDEIHAERERTRARGYSISLQQFDMAQGGVAAPIFDSQGRVSQVVCSLAFSSELNEENVARVGALVAECAQRITERVGGQHPEAPSSPAEQSS